MTDDGERLDALEKTVAELRRSTAVFQVVSVHFLARQPVVDDDIFRYYRIY